MKQSFIQLLHDIEPQHLAFLIQDEHIQIQSVLLSFLKPQSLAQTFIHIPKERQTEILFRISQSIDLQDQTLRDLEESFRQKIDRYQKRHIQKKEGAKLVAAVLDSLDQKTKEMFLAQMDKKKEK